MVREISAREVFDRIDEGMRAQGPGIMTLCQYARFRGVEYVAGRAFRKLRAVGLAGTQTLDAFRAELRRRCGEDE